MPLQSGSSRAAIGHNIETEQSAGKSHAQAVAIALHKAGDARQPFPNETPEIRKRVLEIKRLLQARPERAEARRLEDELHDLMSKAMSRDAFSSVYEEDGKWYINKSGSVRGPFQTRSEAMEARMTGDAGFELTQYNSGKWGWKWPSGKVVGPYPANAAGKKQAEEDMNREKSRSGDRSIADIARDCFYSVGSEPAPAPYAKYTAGDSAERAFRDAIARDVTIDNLAEHLINASEHVRGQTGDGMFDGINDETGRRRVAAALGVTFKKMGKSKEDLRAAMKQSGGVLADKYMESAMAGFDLDPVRAGGLMNSWKK